MEIHFFKYQGAGNDFVMLDNFSGQYDCLTVAQINALCDRRFGIGADGLIKINRSSDSDFYVDYYNADGTQSFCGNGARCSARFVADELLRKDSFEFTAIDGPHEATLLADGNVDLLMQNVDKVLTHKENEYFVHTGSPHYIIFDKDIESLDLISKAHSIRYSEQYKTEGVNVNLLEQEGFNGLKIRTYERGVEGETLACGTGITAAALAASIHLSKDQNEWNIKAIGGDLKVRFEQDNGYKNIHLIGPAEFVFKGKITLDA
jgi:diaminopimelate epimerase